MMNHQFGWAKLLCLCLLGLGVVEGAAQSVSLQPQVLSSSGDVSRVNEPSLDWTLGQTSITTLYTERQMLTQGFQQGDLRVIPIHPADVATKGDEGLSDFTITVYPNPTWGNISIRAQAMDALTGSWQLTDATGRLLQSRTVELTDYTAQLDLSDLPAGTYILQVRNDDQTVLQSYQILKN